MASLQLDLLIVGGGPAGLLASIMATAQNLKHLGIERRPGTQIHPAAHVIKPHTMEIYRRAGIADTVYARGTAPEYQACVSWAESALGVNYGILNLRGKRGPVPRFIDVSPCWPANIPQSVIEPLLLERARAAAQDPGIVQFEEELVDYTQDADGVTAIVNGPQGSREIRCRYLLGADGANSIVRRIAGVEMEGPPVLANFLAINFRSDMRHILERNPGVLIFVRQPDLTGTFIVHQPDGLQVFMLRFDPEETPLDTLDEQRCREIVLQAIGGEHDFEITGVGPWTMSAQVADAYRKGRVLLVGDAAHRFPPTGGLGLNTGAEDVDNLLWKLGAVLRGEAAEALLDSYELECRPTAQRNCAHSVNNNARMALIETALGADAGEAGVAATIDALRHGKEETGAALQSAVDAQVRHFAHLEFDMAAVVEEGAIIPATRDIAHPIPVQEGFQPSFAPGGQIPHLWIQPGVSTLDHLRWDRFTLFVPVQEIGLWSAWAHGRSAGQMPVEIVALPADSSSGIATAADFWGDEPFALLVRPDGRIAWVAPGRSDGWGETLTRVLDQLLSLPC